MVEAEQRLAHDLAHHLQSHGWASERCAVFITARRAARLSLLLGAAPRPAAAPPGVDLLLERRKRRLSLVDAVSFVTMRQRRVVEAFALDPHNLAGHMRSRVREPVIRVLDLYSD